MGIEKMPDTKEEGLKDVKEELKMLQEDVSKNQEPLVDDPPKNGIDSTKTKKNIQVNTGFNAVETTVTNRGDARIRVLANADLTYKKAELGFSGLNEFTKNLETYFGRNVATLGGKDINLKLIGVVKTTKDGVIDDKYGLRYVISDKLGVDYGRVDVAAGKNGGDAAFFLGKNIGKGASVEVFENLGVDKKGKISPYTELQLNKEIFKGLNVFVRGEMTGTDYKKNNYLFGISKPLK